MFQEYDTVIAIKNIENVPKGAKGAILIVYEEANAYEVEFVDSFGNTINVLTVSGDILKLSSISTDL